MSAKARVMVATPDNGEVLEVSGWLRAEGLEPVPVRSLLAALRELQSERFEVVIADASFARDPQLHAAAKARNAAVQVLVLGEPAGAAREAVSVSRPIDQATLMCHVTMAVAEGRPVRRSPRKALTRFAALVEGSPAYLIDVSKEGLRLELPQERRRALPPQFTVRIPMLGISVTVRRVWIGSAPGVQGVAWCGGSLDQAHPHQERNWRTFVETVPAR